MIYSVEVALALSMFRPETLVAFVTVVAITIGGYWTYDSFIRKREGAPRAKVSLTVTDFKVSEDQNVVHAVLTFENIGECLIKLKERLVRFQLVLPADDKKIRERFEKAKVKSDFDVVEEGETFIMWPELACREDRRNGPEAARLIHVEPGETETFYADAVIDSGIQLVRVYGFVENPRTDNLGWACEIFHTVGGCEHHGEERQLRSG